ncbi:MAG TPA: hypothetical protein VK939_11295 [Longimicrobiales bacterium]|nr:hypothetical protein [Longimicrobiales bacterium]
MRTTLLAAVFLPLLCLPAPGALQAQHVPGGPTIDWDAAQNEFTRTVLREYSVLINQWRLSLSDPLRHRSASYYTDGAQLLMSGYPPVQGRDSIGAFLARLAPDLIELRTGISDFMASDRLAFATGPLIFTQREGSDTISVIGSHVTVLVREGRRWRIRSQVLNYDSGTPTAD